MSLSARRAWIEILDISSTPMYHIASLSARRAWIEIASDSLADTSEVESLSARRAWIEIVTSIFMIISSNVALRKESVDRNPENPMICIDKIRRSPQGERG